MARCKSCGNTMSDEAFVLNNGMCDLCVRSTQGEDDPLVIQTIPRPETEAAIAAQNNPYWFKPEQFEGKSIEDYDFHGMLFSRVDCPENEYGKALLLTTHRELSDSEKAKSYISTGLISLFFSIPGIYFLHLFAEEITKVPAGGVSGDNNPYKLLIGVVIFLALVVFILWNNIVKKIVFLEWVLLKDNCIECSRGPKFNPNKSDKYYFDDIGVFKTEDKGGRGAEFYYVEISQPSKDLNISRHAFKIEVENRMQAEYWDGFLNWYIKSKKERQSGQSDVI